MKILTLAVNKAAFDMLADPNTETRKGQEYREIKRFWIAQLLANLEYLTDEEGIRNVGMQPRQFDAIKFTNGYGHKAPSVIREWKGLTIGKPNPLWVPKGFLDLDKDYFRIELGEILTAKQD